MPSVKKAALLVTAMLLSTATLLLALLWFQRLSLPYNEAGRYFDAAHAVVYDEDAITAYGLLTVLFALPTAAAIFWTYRAWRR